MNSPVTYLMNEKQVEALAAAVVAGNDANGTYLRVLVANTQATMSRARPRRRIDIHAAADAALDKVHERFYPHILQGVGDTGREAHRRAAFARSAASTVRYFIRGGGDVRELDAATVTKGGLRKAVAPPEPADKVLRQVARSETALTRSLQRLAKTDPGAAVEHMQRMVDVLTDLSEAFDQQRPGRQPEVETPTVTATRLTRTQRQPLHASP